MKQNLLSVKQIENPTITIVDITTLLLRIDKELENLNNDANRYFENTQPNIIFCAQ